MKSESRRIFISDLPETYTKELLESSFSKYGQVSSVEIKERKELGVNNKSLFFAYVNLSTDDTSLNQCFQDLSNTKWHGQYVELQIARESFLERLRRERQETEAKTKHGIESQTTTKHVENKNCNIGLNSPHLTSKKYNSSSKLKTKNSENETKSNFELDVNIKSEYDSGNDMKNEKLDIVIKSNKNRLFDKGTLKIPSAGKTPIHTISKKTQIKNNSNDDNLKRLESLHKMKKSYKTQKSVIKNALSYSINKPNNKIVFGDGNCSAEEEPNKTRGVNGFTKKALFSEDNPEEDSDMELNFDIKQQFEGKSGQRLLELQSKYKNDKRFALDERFIDEQNEDNENQESFASDDNLVAEKNEQLKILEDILGKKMTTTKDSVSKKTMLKFDPLQPEHSNFQMPVSEPDKKKKKVNLKEQEPDEDSKKSEPEVSKEVFYKVPEKLKETFAEKQQFSLLSMFGRKDETEEDVKKVETEKELKRTAPVGERNPFRYDSSDEEDEIMDIPHKETSNSTSKSNNLDHPQARPSQLVFWTEPFFFKHDDFRLREGLDFIEKIKTEDKEFGKIRRELKGIVKAKVRNSERKNKMFKKKLGGNKRRRHIRIKKALKR